MVFNRLTNLYNYLIADPIGFFVYIIYFVIALLFTLVVHEVAHGYVAYLCGDNTAKYLGRLSLNPLKHLDPIGMTSMVLFGFGWAKPVPINPRNFRNALKDDFLVSIAGVTVNFLLFLFSLSIMVILNRFLWKPEVLAANSYTSLLHSGGVGYSYIINGNFKYIQDLINSNVVAYIQRFLMIFSSFNLVIAIFNLLPIPPLDGFHVVNDLFFKGKLNINSRINGIITAIFYISIFSGYLGRFIVLIKNFIETNILNLFILLIGKA